MGNAPTRKKSPHQTHLHTIVVVPSRTSKLVYWQWTDDVWKSYFRAHDELRVAGWRMGCVLVAVVQMPAAVGQRKVSVELLFPTQFYP